MPTPEHYQQLMPYIVVEDADGFISFVKKVFGAEEKLMVRNDDGSLMHAEIIVNGGTIMVGEAKEQWAPFPAPMYLPTHNVDSIYAAAVENGAEGNMEPSDREYGRAAGFKDKWGNQWWLNSPEAT